MARKFQFRDIVQDEYHFEEQCLAILTTPPDNGHQGVPYPYGQSDTYGKKGQKQYGADLIAKRSDEKWDIGQCKHYEEFRARKVEHAVDEFLKYWDSRWNTWGVARFILFVSCETDSTSIQDEAKKQIERLNKFSIGFELWGDNRLYNELLLRCSLFKEYSKNLQGYHQGYTDGVQDTVAKYEMKVQFLSTSFKDILEAFRIRWESRPMSEILVDLEQKEIETRTKGDNTNEAKLIRLRATLLIDSGNVDLETLQSMHKRVEMLVPGDPANIRLNARIIDFEGNVNEAIDLLENQVDGKSVLQRAALLLSRANQNKNGESHDLDIEKAHQILLRAELQKDPDARRLEAYRLMYGNKQRRPNLKRALEEIDNSLSIRESWVSKYLKGMILFWLAMSPSVRPWFPVGVPRPSVSRFPLPTDDAIELLEKANVIFKQLSVESDIFNRIEQVSIWRLVVLVAKGESCECLSQFVRDFLLSYPNSPMIIWYALELGVKLNIDEIRTQAEDQVISGEDCDLWYQVDLHPRIRPLSDIDALEKLESLRDTALNRSKQHPVQLKRWWLLQMAMRLIENQKRDEALLLKSEARDDIELSQELELICYEDDPEKLIELLSDDIQSDSFSRLGLVQVLASIGKFEEAVNHIPLLVSEVGTLQVYKIGMRLAAETDNSELALNIVSSWPSAQKDIEVESIHVWALQQTGQLREALEKAQGLIGKNELSHHDKVQIHQQYIRLLLHLGKADKALGETRELLNLFILENDNINTALFIADILSHDQLSKEKLKMLILSLLDKDLSDDQLIRLYFLGNSLGLDEVSKKIVPVLPKLAERNPQTLFMTETEETLDILRKQQERGSKLEELWRKGEIPVHLFAAEGRGILSRIYHSIPEAQEKQRRFVPGALPIFYAGRMMTEIGESQNVDIQGPLIADVTSLMLAEHLGILEDIVLSFGPINISSSLFELFHHIASQLEYHQPHRLELYRYIVKAVEDEALNLFNEDRDFRDVSDSAQRAWERRIIKAKELDAVYLPGDLSGCPQGDKTPIVRRHNILSIIQTEVDQGVYLKIKERFLLSDRADENEFDITPKDGAKIVTDTIVLHEMAEVPEVLLIFLNHFKVYICESEFNVDQNQLLQASKMEGEKKWVTGLREKIADGILKSPQEFKIDNDQDTKPVNDEVPSDLPEIKFLKSFVEKPQFEMDLWTDDRHLNRWTKVNNKSIFTTIDLLNQMYDKGVVDEDKYMHTLLRLRRGGFQYIPVKCEEILYHISNAPIKNHGVVETPELRSLRRVIAFSGLGSEHLQLVLNDQNQKNEYFYFITTISQVVDALVKVIKIQSDEGWIRFAWILHSLYFEEVYINTLNPERASSDLCCSMRSLAGSRLISSAIQINDRDQQEDYIQRIWKYLVSSWFNNDVRVREGIISALYHDIITILTPEKDDEETAKVINQHVTHYFLALPNPIKRGIREQFGIPPELQIVETETVKINGLGLFANIDLIKALKRVMEAGNGTLSNLKGEKVEVCNINGCIMLIKGEKSGEFTEELYLRACDNNEEKWNDFCHENVLLLDRTVENRNSKLIELCQIQSPEERVSAWRRETENTQEKRLENLNSRICQSRIDVGWEDFEPASFAHLLGHLRIIDSEIDQPWYKVQDKIVERLFVDYDPVTIFFRLAGLPDGIPLIYTEHLLEKEKDEQSSILNNIWTKIETSTDLMEVLYLSLSINPSLATLHCNRRLREIIDDKEQTFLDMAINDYQLVWNIEEVVRNGLIANPNVSDALIWRLASLHSNQIHRIVKSNPIDGSAFLKWIEELSLEKESPEFTKKKSEQTLWRNPIERVLRLLALIVVLADDLSEKDKSCIKKKIYSVYKYASDQVDVNDDYWIRGGIGDLKHLFLKKMAPEMLSASNNTVRFEKIRSLLNQLSLTPNDPTAQNELTFSLGLNAVPGELEYDLESAIRNLNTESESVLKRISFFSAWAIDMITKNDSIFTLLEEHLIKIASTTQVTPAQIEFAIRKLSQYSMSVSPIQAYRRMMIRLIDNDPSLATEYVTILLQIALKSKAEYASQVWALLIRFRAIAEKIDLSLPEENMDKNHSINGDLL